MTQPIYDFGGAGPVIHLAVANGFPPQVYEPLVKPLTENYRVLCLPPRALWPNEQPPDKRRDWSALADDLLHGLRRYDFQDVIAVGHSFGGIVSILAALAEPARFRALCLLDPTVLPPPVMQMVAAMQSSGASDEFPLVQGALRRRRRFESVEDAYRYFREKTLFLDWPETTLRLYAQHSLRPATDGHGFELAWSPEWEAYYFGTLYTRTWEDLPRLRGLLPLLTLRGENSDTLLPEAAAQMRALLPEMRYAEITGHGHLFPQSAPVKTSSVILEWIRTLS